MMKKNLVDYFSLDSKQKEKFNYYYLANVLACYGYICISLSTDWNGADFLAQHYKSGEILKIQLKSRLTIDKKYKDPKLYMACPLHGTQEWVIIKHCELIKTISDHCPHYLESKSWRDKGTYSNDAPKKELCNVLKKYAWISQRHEMKKIGSRRKKITSLKETSFKQA